MKNRAPVWRCALCLLPLSAVLAFFCARYYLAWNVPPYAACMAAIFLVGAAAFALLAAAKGKPKKRLLPSALCGGAIAAGGVFLISLVVNVLICHVAAGRRRRCARRFSASLSRWAVCCG